MNKLGLRDVAYTSIKKKYPKLTKIQITDILETVIESMIDALVDTKRLSMRGFGILEVTYLKERPGFHPKFLKPIIIPARAKIKFVPAQTLRNRINSKPKSQK